MSIETVLPHVVIIGATPGEHAQIEQIVRDTYAGSPPGAANA
ncbi:hypothetical protein [Shinella sp.]